MPVHMPAVGTDNYSTGVEGQAISNLIARLPSFIGCELTTVKCLEFAFPIAYQATYLLGGYATSRCEKGTGNVVTDVKERRWLGSEVCIACVSSWWCLVIIVLKIARDLYSSSCRNSN